MDGPLDTNSDNGFIFEKINENYNIREEKNPVSHLRNDLKDPLLFTWISPWTEPEALQE